MRTLRLWFVLLGALPALLSMSPSTGATDDALAAADDGRVPWNHQQFDAAPDKFTFAVHGDLTGGERAGVFQHAAAALALLRPEFLVSIGDLIEGAPDDGATLAEQWVAYEQRVSQLRGPTFYVGGNHDLTSEGMRAAWRERHGPTYYHFVYRNALFLVLDTEDHTEAKRAEIASKRNAAISVLETSGRKALEQTPYFHMPERTAGTIGAAQAAYFRDAIAANPGVNWTFLFMHKAPWQREGEANFASIEEALSDRRYTVFHGHEHSFRYLQRKGNDYIRMATTGGEQIPGDEQSVDHVLLVTVDDQGVDIANLRLAGILDRRGQVPAGE